MPLRLRVGQGPPTAPAHSRITERPKVISRQRRCWTLNFPPEAGHSRPPPVERGRCVSWATEKSPIPILPMSRRPDGLKRGSAPLVIPSSAPSADRLALPPMWCSRWATVDGDMPSPSSSTVIVPNRGRSVLMTTLVASASYAFETSSRIADPGCR